MAFGSKKEQTPFRRLLRRRGTYTERKLWNAFKERGFFGYKFRRQYGIGRYIADFYCPALRLIIEIDGSQHFSKEGKESDRSRTSFLEEIGMKVLRFTNREVLNNQMEVLESIAHFVRPPLLK